MAALLTAASACAQAPSGRWDGNISLGAMSVPFTLFFEGKGAAVTGAFINGDARVSSAPGKFEGGTLRLSFPQAGTRLEAVIADGALKGSYGDARRGMHPFTAAAFCTCSNEGDAGPAIMGEWDVPGAGGRLTVRRIGEDTLAALKRAGDALGPLAGRFNGGYFVLNYFDGTRAAVLELEPNKDHGLDVTLNEPGQDIRKYKAVRAP